MRSEEEQLEAIKQWWSENGLSLVATVVIVAGGWFGWQAWQDQKIEKAQAASELFLDIQQAVIDQGVVSGEISPQELEIIRSIGFLTDEMQDNFAGNGFSTLGALAAARAAADRNDYAQAETRLQWALDNTKDDALVELVQYRLALAKAAQGKSDEALQLLTGASAAYAALYAEARGDINLALGNSEKAAAEYQLAMQSLSADQQSYTPALDTKLAAAGGSFE